MIYSNLSEYANLHLVIKQTNWRWSHGKYKKDQGLNAATY